MLQKRGSWAEEGEGHRPAAICGRSRLKSAKCAWAILALLDFVAAGPSWAQRAQLATEDYARAEGVLPWNAVKLAFHLDVEPHWIEASDRFWYRSEDTSGKKFVLVDPEKNTSQAAFDHERLAKGLSEASGKSYEANKLPFDSFAFAAREQSIDITVGDVRWVCGIEAYRCARSTKPKTDPGEVLSPDEHWVAFVKNHDLYVRSIAAKVEVRLTSDGAEYNDYGTAPESNTSAITDRILEKGAHRINVLWSPDSRKILTYKLDQRKVRQSYLVQSVAPGAVGTARPLLYSYRYPFPGDKEVATAKLVVFDVAKRTRIPLDLPALTVTFMTPFEFKWVWWNKNGSEIYLIQKDRWWKTLVFSVTDAGTGHSRNILEEHGATQIEPAPGFGEAPLVKVLGDGAEVVWFSEREGWGHLYLYDGKSGKLKNQITSGPWLVREIQYVDEKNRWIYFTAGGREEGRDPYLRHLYRAKLDGSDPQLLTPEDADHNVSFSPSGAFFVDTYSRVDLPPMSVLRSADGKILQELEHADLSRLLAKSWRFPEPFHAKAADGVTELYGAIFRPSNFDPSMKYPILDSIYPGPQHTRAPKTIADPLGKIPDSCLDLNGTAQSMAELGFVVVTVDGRGTPMRSKAFHDFSYGKLGDAGGLEDHVAVIKELGARYPYMDLDRVGIYGHSGGGFASVRAMLVYPDFYKVAVASAGEHDMRGYIAEWGEKYQGPLENGDYDEASNPALALKAVLKGKLLLAWGDMDDNVPPSLELQLISSLIKRNEDFDTLVLPNQNHISSMLSPYFMRRRWDYLVRNLLGAEPPSGYEIKTTSPLYRPLEMPPK
jgi:dipeptidyl-peptidase-4